MSTINYCSGTYTVPYSSHHCGWCGDWHSGRCPRVRAIEYWPNGTVKRVEFYDDYHPWRPAPVPYNPWPNPWPRPQPPYLPYWDVNKTEAEKALYRAFGK